MSTELMLEKVSKETLEELAHNTDVSKHFTERGYNLFLGKRFGDYQNMFWLDPALDKYSVDYSNNICRIIGNLLGSLNLAYTNPKSKEEKKYCKSLVSESIQQLILYVEENLQMFTTGKINYKRESLNVQNKRMFMDFWEFNLKLKRLVSLSIWTPEFNEQVGDILGFYREASEKYRRQSTRAPLTKK